MNDEQNFLNNEPQQRDLPNAKAVRILGIASIVGALAYALPGIILGVIGLRLANKDRALYKASPGSYLSSSYSRSRKGRTCSIIGLALGSAILLVVIVYLIFYGDFTRGPWRQYNVD